MLPIKRASHCSDLIRVPTGVLAILLVFGIRSNGQTTGDAGGLGDTKRLWEVTIEEPASAVEYKASAVSPQDESIWLVIGRLFITCAPSVFVASTSENPGMYGCD